MKNRLTKFSGFGNVIKTYSRQVTYVSLDTVNQNKLFRRQISVRRTGNAYGDAATNNNGNIFLTSQLPKFIQLDSKTGRCKVSANTTVRELLKYLHNSDWSVEVAPGSGFVTIGGCVASDVHGKNHPGSGSFSQTLKKITIYLPSGEQKILTDSKSDLWRSTCGGMGLTGLITEVELQLEKTKCKKFITNKYFTGDFYETLEVVYKLNQTNKSYILAWTDFSLTNNNFGRSIVYQSVRCDDFCQNKTFKPLLITIPILPFSIVNKVTTKLLNFLKFNCEKLIFNKSSKTISSSEQSILFPSDIAKKWNRAFGRSGLMEYQFSFPFGKEKDAEKILRYLATHVPPALSAIKIFGPGNMNYLSFPSEGYVVGITFPWKRKYLQIVTKLDEEVSKMGFKKYLSKDLFTESRLLYEMYPKLKLFLKFKKSIDPQEMFVSDMYKRILKLN